MNDQFERLTEMYRTGQGPWDVPSPDTMTAAPTG